LNIVMGLGLLCKYYSERSKASQKRTAVGVFLVLYIVSYGANIVSNLTP